MRLWHKDLIDVLPDKQLAGQWRECCLIAKGLHDGTLNHLLVNKVTDYSIDHLCTYAWKVAQEMKKRGKHPIWLNFYRYMPNDTGSVPDDELFLFWHDNRYLVQCFYNLQEKADCGGVDPGEWMQIVKKCCCDLKIFD